MSEIICLNFQGSKSNNVCTEDGTVYSLNAMHGHDIHVICFQQNQREKVRNMGEKAGTLTAESGMHNTNYVMYQTGEALCFIEREGCSGGGKGLLAKEEQAFTLSTSTIEKICYSIEGNSVDRKSKKNGKGWCKGVSPTLNTQDKHAVVYAIDALSSNSMKSNNPNSGFHETTVSKCLDTACCEPTCNQGGVVVVVNSFN